MDWQQLTDIRHEWELSEVEMAEFLGTALSTYTGWKKRGNGVPMYIANSVIAHNLLTKKKFHELLIIRGIR